MRRVRGQRTTDSFKRLLLCIFSRTGRNFTRICEVLPNEYTPQWIAARIGLHGHGSLLGDDVWYAVHLDYSDLPSDTCKQTARSLWLAMLSERGVTPTTADQIKFDVFVTSLQDAPAWQEQKKLEKAERASQKEASADAHALGLGPSSLERRKHTLASYLMGPNAVGRQQSTGTWRPTSGPAPQRRCKAPGGTCYVPVPKNCSKGMCTPHCLSFQIAYAQRFATCTPCKYKKSGVRHRHTPRATDATELAPWIGCKTSPTAQIPHRVRLRSREVHAQRIWRGDDCRKRVGPTSPSGLSKPTNSNTHVLRSFLGTSKRAYAYIPESDLKSKLR